MKKLLFALVAGAALSTSANAATILSENFESGFGVFTPSGQVDVATGNDYIGCCGTSGSSAAMSNHFVAFGSANQPSGSILSTTFNTVLNATYTLTFDYGALGAGSESLTLVVGGQTFVVNPVANDILDSTFTSAMYTFVGTGGATALNIYSGGVANVDAVIDNISVTGAAVPEPATWALMLLGFGGIGFAMRRRKTATPQLG